MKKYFEYKDNKSKKFWSIDMSGLSIEYNYGKIGNKGRFLTKKFSSKKEAKKEFDKKIKEKINKGYLLSKKRMSELKTIKIIKQSKKKKKMDKGVTKNKEYNLIDDLKSRKVLWNIKRDGIMLAHTFRDNKTGKIKAAPPNTPQAPNGWWLSEKYDGYRAIWNGKNFISRNGNIFNAPEYFKKWMPGNIVLDGELFIGRDTFEKHGILRKKIPIEKEWIDLDIKYHIFDSPSHKGVFEDRMKYIKNIIKMQCKIKGQKGKCPLILVSQKKIKNENEMMIHFNKILKKKGEGVMLRAPNSPYDKKRSSYLLKVKPKFDDECKIIGYKDGTGKYKGKLGAFRCNLLKNRNIEFDLSGMSDKIRDNYKKTHPIGTIITFTYMGLSVKGVPRHPNYLRIRK